MEAVLKSTLTIKTGGTDNGDGYYAHFVEYPCAGSGNTKEEAIKSLLSVFITMMCHEKKEFDNFAESFSLYSF